MNTTMSANNYVGQILDEKYRLMDLLGQGGMGAVYKGEHLVLKKQVAIKFLHMGFAQDEQVVKRFYREAQAAAAIGHEGIIDVLDVGIAPSKEPYLVMEYLEGESLAQLLARSAPLSIPTACGIMEPVLVALHAAHTKGIIHRDLKPENIFLCYQNGSPPKVKVIDFGISKFATGPKDEKLTQTGSVMGTPAYMSPEQAKGNSELDHRTDIFSMGVIFYEMLTGKLPFAGDSFTEIIVNIITGDPVPPAEAFEDFPKEAEGILGVALSKEAQSRYTDALSFLDALHTLPEFQDRQTQLTKISSQATKTTFASGDLGLPDTHMKTSDIAAHVLSKAAGISSGTGWNNGEVSSPPSGTRKLLPLLVILVILLLGIVGTFLWMGSVKESQEPIAHPHTEQDVMVASKPDGADVLIKGAKVGQTPMTITVNKGTNILIQKKGYAPQALLLSPTSDPNVIVELIEISSGGDSDVDDPTDGDVQQGTQKESVAVAKIENKSGRRVDGAKKSKSKGGAASVSETETESTEPAPSSPVVSSSTASNAKDTESSTAAKSSPSSPKTITRVKKDQYDNMRDLKMDYRAGLVDKYEYKQHQKRIRIMRQKEYDDQKKLYREGQIDKVQYKQRIKQIKLKYEGLL